MKLAVFAVLAAIFIVMVASEGVPGVDKGTDAIGKGNDVAKDAIDKGKDVGTDAVDKGKDFIDSFGRRKRGADDMGKKMKDAKDKIRGGMDKLKEKADA